MKLLRRIVPSFRPEPFTRASCQGWQWLWVLLCLFGVGLAQAAPVILNAPQDQSALVGSNVTFSVSATTTATTNGGFNYGDLSGWPSTNAYSVNSTSGTLNFSYLFGTLNDRMTVYYGANQIYDTGYVGGPNTSYFTVNYGPGTGTSVIVIINEGNPNNHGSKWGYQLSMQATIYYQWQFNSTNISGATNAAYTVTSITTNQAGNYRVVVTDNTGPGTNAAATLTVRVPPSVTQPPVGLTVLAGGSSNFTVTATGTLPLNYQWQRNGTNIAGATSAIYAFTNAQPSAAGNYTVIITNLAGSVTSPSAGLTVLVTPILTGVSGSSTNFSFTWQTVVGSNYVTEYKTNLNAAGWTPIATNAGTGNLLSENFPMIPGVACRFYRVVVR